jgi:protein TonB
MKIASCFLISAAFHAAILTFPITGFDTERERVVPVALLVETRKMLTQTPARNNDARKSETKSRKKINKKPEIKKPVEESVEPSKPNREEEVKNDMFPPVIEEVREKEPAVAEVTRPDVKKVKVFSTTVVKESAKNKQQPKEEVSLRTEVNFRHVVEEGKNSMPLPEPSFTRAGYAYNPRPHYPEEARREGWEGEVLLRVLVDSEGRPESIELSRSSGFEPLDQAALQSVQSWRFHPARHGERQVESWVKIPIVFRLADLKN